ncbi:hypothetical protein A33I_20840 [Alkalihalophilus marmarensis DSM 21297]|uniref:Uncharacterized protein n=1 Tax=Alkalihalophilus marmarensis DSM 21297 TaxID=1188261 RepID=U6SIH0_9BACI|nr:hypothetical protein A33I_20840 [Alkalihalophilus marmarensis DSM 21297]
MKSKKIPILIIFIFVLGGILSYLYFMKVFIPNMM